jgi:hypothetical protein
MKRYIISGLPPNIGGTGVFFSYLISINDTHRVIYKKHKYFSNPISTFSYIFNIIYRKLQIHNFLYCLKLVVIQNSEIILLHPQTIGYRLFIRLLRKNKVVKWYILDNSYFCIRSYNFNPKTEDECLKCLGYLNPELYCIPYPVNYKKEVLLKYLKEIKSLSGKIYFYLQNEKQEELVKLHFGSSVNTLVVGMRINGFNDSNLKNINRTKKLAIYHGGLSLEKGIKYVIRLFNQLDNYTLVIPYSKNQVEGYYKEPFPENIVFKKMTWNTGLKEYVEKASIVFCPSIWSAPIEGALVKSLFYNANVAVIDTEFGFQKEIPKKHIIRLTGKIEFDLVILLENFNKSIQQRVETFNWIKEFIHKSKIEKMLE